MWQKLPGRRELWCALNVFTQTPICSISGKAHILSYIEYRTAAWYHACETTIAPLDRCLSSFLRKIGVDDITALMNFNLAPLHTRRDMAMLAVIHRAALRKGPPAFHAFIRHSAQQNRASVLVEYRNCGNRLEIMRRS